MRLCLFVMGLIFHQHVYAITLKQLLSDIKQNHPAILIETQQIEIEKQKKKALKGVTDWNIYIDLYYKNETFSSFRESSYIGIRSGTGTTLWRSGINFGGSGGASKSEYKTNSRETSYFPEASYGKNYNYQFSLTAPLMRDFAGVQTRFTYEQAEYDEAQQKLLARNKNEFFLLTVIDDFLLWERLTQQQRVIQRYINKFQKSKTLRNNIQPKDRLQISSQIYYYKTKLTENQSSIASVKEKLIEMTGQIAINHDPPQYDLFQVFSNGQDDIFTTESMNSLLKIKTEDIYLEKLSHEKIKLNNDKLPVTNVAVRHNHNKSRSDGSQANNTFDSNTISITVGSDFTNTRTTQDLKKVFWQSQNTEQKQQELRLRFSADIKRNQTQRKILQQQISTQKVMIALLEKQTDLEWVAYQTGSLPLATVLKNMKQHFLSEMDYIEMLAKYHQLFFQYLNLTDQLYDRY